MLVIDRIKNGLDPALLHNGMAHGTRPTHTIFVTALACTGNIHNSALCGTTGQIDKCRDLCMVGANTLVGMTVLCANRTILFVIYADTKNSITATNKHSTMPKVAVLGSGCHFFSKLGVTSDSSC